MSLDRRRCLLCLTLVLAVLLVPGPGRAEPSAAVSPDRWEAHLTFSDGAAKSRVSLGLRPDAGDGWDRIHEVKLLPGAGLQARFEHPGWPGTTAWARDVRGPGLPAAWEITVDRLRPGRSVTIRWDLRFVPVGCERVDLALVDRATGEVVDLRRATSHTFVPTTTGPRLFEVRATLARSKAPGVPRGVVARRPGRSGQVVVHWQPPHRGDVSVAGYLVYRRESDGRLRRLTELPIFERTFHDRSLPEDATGVTYLVRAVSHAMCEGAPSDAGAPRSSARGKGE